MLKVYHSNICPFSRKLRAVLQEKGIKFQLIETKYWERSSDFLAMNPAAETPVLIDLDDNIISSNYAIFEYIEDAFKDHPLLSEDRVKNAEIRMVCSWFDKKFYDEVTKYIISEKILKLIDKNTPNLMPNSGAIRAAKKNILYHLDYIAFLLRKEQYLCGPKIRLADYAAAAQLSILDMLNDVPWDYNHKVKAWYALIKSRASFRATLLDDTPHITPPTHYLDPDF